MDFTPSPQAADFLSRVGDFIDAEITPREREYLDTLRSQEDRWAVPEFIGELKAKARAEGLWNLFLPDPAWARA